MRRRHREAKRLRGSQVYDEIEFRRLRIHAPRRWLNGDVDQAELFELKQKYEPPVAVGGQRARVAGVA